MGDLVRDALRASGIDEHVEEVIADALVQSWNENRSAGSNNNRPATERKSRTGATEPNLAKVRIIAEQLWRRLERIYDAKLQAWKQNEEKTMDEMIARLRHEYKENLLLKQRQLDELAERKEDEYKNKEDMLREDIRVTFEKKKLECEKAWREIEAAQKELKFRKQLLDNAWANFRSKKDNELYDIERERRSLEQIKESLKMHEKNLNQKLREGIRKTREKDRARMAQMISEWNKKETILSEKYGMVWDKIREITAKQQTSAEEVARLRKLEKEMIQHQKKLAESEHALSDTLEKLRKTNEDLEMIKKEKEELSKENQNLREKLERRESAVNSLKKRLTLVEESAAIRISDLKLQQKLTTDKLQTIGSKLRKYHSRESEKLREHQSPPNIPIRTTLLDSTSPSSTTPTESSFEHHFRDKMRELDIAKQHLDLSLEKLCLRGQSEPLDYIQTVQYPHAEATDDFDKPLSTNSLDRKVKQPRRGPSITEADTAQSGKPETASQLSPKSPVLSRTVVVEKTMEKEVYAMESGPENDGKYTEVDIAKDSPRNPKIDPLMLRYMKMVEEQREKEKSVPKHPVVREDVNLVEESFVVEAAERPDTPNTPSDFDW